MAIVLQVILNNTNDFAKFSHSAATVRLPFPLVVFPIDSVRYKSSIKTLSDLGEV
jgi:hypothetical protein